MSDIHPVFEDENESDHWISVADMMAGLMVIFMFITISYILFGLDETDREKLTQSEQETWIENLQKENDQLKDTLDDMTQDSLQSHQQRLEEKKQRQSQIKKLQNRNNALEFTLKNAIESYEKKYKQTLKEWKQKLVAEETEGKIYRALKNEFEDNLREWGAELLPDLTIKFKSPEVLFDTASDTLKPLFEEVLSDFIPRYLQILSQFKINIEEIRIEGHTSSKWGDSENDINAYFKNMELSQSRTRAVLKYSLEKTGKGETGEEKIYTWARSLLTANGLSSSRLIRENGVENPELSRRVEFKIRIKVKQEILKTLEELQ